ncbi:MAG: polysaccharide export protein [Alphaproteobacteria bacterium]|nr:polysaccharide biosynthesis/export family protein [Alphaproteobacteria bacterium]TAD86963.1 MAG: polysaccharide export protein [Alphaproteobacteria bacterium]
MFRARLIACTIAAALLVGCAGPSLPPTPAPTTAINPAEGYRLEPGNRVRVLVFGETNLSGDMQVDGAGNISMPLVGNIPASGLTSVELATRVEETLKRDNFLREPRVSVEVMTFRPFYVLGEVRSPGEFPFTLGMTVLSAIARAGGYDYRAREGEVVLVRVTGGEQLEYRATERTPIQPGDIIRVLQRRL